MTPHASTPRTAHPRLAAAAVAAVTTALVLGLAGQAGADENPSARALQDAAAQAHRAAVAPASLDTLSRFFARDGAVSRDATPRVQPTTVPVYTLSPDFVAGTPGAEVAKLEFLAGAAVSSDGRKASVWMAPHEGAWKVVNIATGDDETRYAAEGARKLPGGTVFREPQIDAWYVHDASRVLPLDADAVRAVGTRGATLAAYRARVHRAYADKLPGTAYAKQGRAGGYAAAGAAGAAGAAVAPAGHGTAAVSDSTPAVLPAAGGALALLGAAGIAVARLRGRREAAG
ncbi:hypothetical protein ACQPZG_26310 [Streptomyces sp. CA-294286]|uniref:hypothetical protein n=1 Tax=Streptomyces sp. CA-294286 TaxID=3240070 RepID=UPI003D94E5A9